MNWGSSFGTTPGIIKGITVLPNYGAAGVGEGMQNMNTWLQNLNNIRSFASQQLVQNNNNIAALLESYNKYMNGSGGGMGGDWGSLVPGSSKPNVTDPRYMMANQYANSIDQMERLSSALIHRAGATFDPTGAYLLNSNPSAPTMTYQNAYYTMPPPQILKQNNGSWLKIQAK